MNWTYIRTQINTFFKKLYGNDSELSSKRVVGFNAFLLLASTVIVVMCGGPAVPQFMFYGIIVLISACFGLNTMESLKALSSKTDVANTIAQSDSSPKTNDQAKEVLQADLPK